MKKVKTMENVENYIRLGISPIIDTYVDKINELFKIHQEQLAECWIKQIEHVIDFTKTCETKKEQL